MFEFHSTDIELLPIMLTRTSNRRWMRDLPCYARRIRTLPGAQPHRFSTPQSQSGSICQIKLLGFAV